MSWLTRIRVLTLLVVAVTISLGAGTGVALAHVPTSPDFVSGWNWYPARTHTQESWWTYSDIEYSFDQEIYGYQDPNGGGDDFQFEDQRFSNWSVVEGVAWYSSIHVYAAGHTGVTFFDIICEPVARTGLEDPLIADTQKVFEDMTGNPYYANSKLTLLGDPSTEESCSTAGFSTQWDIYSIEEGGE